MTAKIYNTIFQVIPYCDDPFTETVFMDIQATIMKHLLFIFTACSELYKVLFLALSVTYFGCVLNISGTAEQNGARFTGKTCLVPHSDKFECQGQRDKKQYFLALLATCMHFMFGKTSLDSSSSSLHFA